MSILHPVSGQESKSCRWPFLFLYEGLWAGFFTPDRTCGVELRFILKLTSYQSFLESRLGSSFTQSVVYYFYVGKGLGMDNSARILWSSSGPAMQARNKFIVMSA